MNCCNNAEYLWCALLAGCASGALATVFAKAYRAVDRLMNEVLAKSAGEAKFILIFMTVALFGFISSDLTGSGHHIIADILYGRAPVWYLTALYLTVRAALLLFANTAGITGGIFFRH